MFPEDSEDHKKMKFLTHLREVSPAFRRYEKARQHACTIPEPNPLFEKLLANEARLTQPERDFYVLRQIWNEWNPLGEAAWGIDSAYDQFAQRMQEAMPAESTKEWIKELLEEYLLELNANPKLLEKPEGQEAIQALANYYKRRDFTT